VGFRANVRRAVQFAGVDVAGEVGPYGPLLREFTVVPKRPVLVIELVSKLDNAMLNGIDVYARKPTSATEGARRLLRR
jgi:hypothetical protein